MFVDCYQKDFWVIWLCRLLDFKECWTKGWPFVNNFQELYFGFIRRHSSFFVVVGNDLLRKNKSKIMFHYKILRFQTEYNILILEVRFIAIVITLDKKNIASLFVKLYIGMLMNNDRLIYSLSSNHLVRSHGISSRNIWL